MFNSIHAIIMNPIFINLSSITIHSISNLLFYIFLSLLSYKISYTMLTSSNTLSYSMTKHPS